MGLLLPVVVTKTIFEPFKFFLYLNNSLILGFLLITSSAVCRNRICFLLLKQLRLPIFLGEVEETLSHRDKQYFLWFLVSGAAAQFFCQYYQAYLMWVMGSGEEWDYLRQLLLVGNRVLSFNPWSLVNLPSFFSLPEFPYGCLLCYF
jgi:hypothetical protein